MTCRNCRNVHRPGMRLSSGFTLIEVLVATAITGIALGVLLSGIGMGHTQAFRGDMKRTAAHIAERLLREAVQDPMALSDDSGDVEGYPGWSYRIELRDLNVTVKAPILDQGDDEGYDLEERELELPEFRVLTLRVIPPEDAPAFTLTSIVPSEEQTGIIQSVGRPDAMPSKGQSGVTRPETQSGTVPSKKK
jgi:prepilin-type N-terminal cleavage/methylation domain-containing protein